MHLRKVCLFFFTFFLKFNFLVSKLCEDPELLKKFLKSKNNLNNGDAHLLQSETILSIQSSRFQNILNVKRMQKIDVNLKNQIFPAISLTALHKFYKNNIYWYRVYGYTSNEKIEKHNEFTHLIQINDDITEIYFQKNKKEKRQYNRELFILEALQICCQRIIFASNCQSINDHCLKSVALSNYIKFNYIYHSDQEDFLISRKHRQLLTTFFLHGSHLITKGSSLISIDKNEVDPLVNLANNDATAKIRAFIGEETKTHSASNSISNLLLGLKAPVGGNTFDIIKCNNLD